MVTARVKPLDVRLWERHELIEEIRKLRTREDKMIGVLACMQARESAREKVEAVK